jgi:quercetin dioxygenase-like cupin family protein
MLPMSDIIVDPVRRQRYRFFRDGADLLAEVETDPGVDVPEHIHPTQTEDWEVITGEVTFFIDGRPQAARPGDRIRADPGVRHAFVNDGVQTAILKVRVTPADDLQTFLVEAARLARDGAFDAKGKPSSPRAAFALIGLAVRHRKDIQITTPAPMRIFNIAGRVLR